jgi:hypothetical protein
MKCSDVEQLFDAYLERSLSGSLRLEFEAHRLRCRRCQQALAMLESAVHVIAHDRREPPLSPDFTERVMDEIRDRQPIWRRLRLNPATVSMVLLAQAAVLAVAAVMISQWTPPPAAGPALVQGGARDSAVEYVDRYEHFRARVLDEIRAGMSRALSEGRPVRAESIPEDLALMLRYGYANLQLPEELARQSLEAASGNWATLFESLVLPAAAEADSAGASPPDRHSL